ncbi:uncharacterized protein LOC144135376 [Amblyomma americanum]
MALSSFASPEKTVAFTFQMGTAIFEMAENYTTYWKALYKPCRVVLIKDRSRWCGPYIERSVHLDWEETFALVAQVSGKTYFLSLDIMHTLLSKAQQVIYTRDLRENFTWFLFNVHLMGLTQCIDPPRARLEKFRGFFNQYITERGIWNSAARRV